MIKKKKFILSSFTSIFFIFLKFFKHCAPTQVAPRIFQIQTFCLWNFFIP